LDRKRRKGRLERWNDDRGFGFIRTHGSEGDVFLHISAFKGRIDRRPKVGDSIFYEIHTGPDARVRAVNATIEGLAAEPARTSSGPKRRSKPARHGRKRWSAGTVSLLLVLVVAVFLYRNNPFPTNTSGGARVLPNATDLNNSAYRCEGKVYCAEMRSCDEAVFYLRNCPNTKMDGDGDGVPCESQWCGR